MDIKIDETTKAIGASETVGKIKPPLDKLVCSKCGNEECDCGYSLQWAKESDTTSKSCTSLEHKQTIGKAKWHLTNLKDLEGIVRIREWATADKYTDPNNWKEVEPINWVDAIKRHLAEIDDKGIFSLDDESGLPHIWHIGTNFSFLSYHFRMIEEGKKRKKEDDMVDSLVKEIENSGLFDDIVKEIPDGKL